MLVNALKIVFSDACRKRIHAIIRMCLIDLGLILFLQYNDVHPVISVNDWNIGWVSELSNGFELTSAFYEVERKGYSILNNLSIIYLHYGGLHETASTRLMTRFPLCLSQPFATWSAICGPFNSTYDSSFLFTSYWIGIKTLDIPNVSPIDTIIHF